MLVDDVLTAVLQGQSQDAPLQFHIDAVARKIVDGIGHMGQNAIRHPIEFGLIHSPSLLIRFRHGADIDSPLQAPANFYIEAPSIFLKIRAP